MRRLLPFFGCWLLLMTVSAPAAAARRFPQPIGHVNDFARVLAPSTEAEIEALLRALEAKTTIEMVIVTIYSLQEEPIEELAVALFKEWGIGQRGEDNGILLLIAPTERAARIEVGYGLEPILTDSMAGRISREVMVPEFRQGRLDLGTRNGAAALVDFLNTRMQLGLDVYATFGDSAQYMQRWSPDLPAAAPEATNLSAYDRSMQRIDRAGKATGIVLLSIFSVLLVISFFRYPKLFQFFLFFLWACAGRGGGGGRLSGGSFRGFGGGMSGGGGATVRW